MEFVAIVGRVIKTPQPAEGIVTIILKTGIPGDLLAQLDLAVQDVVELAGFLKPPSGNEFPRLLSERASGFFEIAAHLDERFFPALKMDRERAA